MGKAKKRGPKLKPEHEKQTKSFLMKMTESEYDLVKSAADGKLATWARETLLKAAKRKVKSGKAKSRT